MENTEDIASIIENEEDESNEKITKESFVEMLKVSIAKDKAKMVADLIFTAFDTDRDGMIDFEELMVATNCINATMPEEKLHWVFQMYDKDHSNSIQLVEMVEIFRMLYLCEGLDEKIAVERAEEVFTLLDSNHDGDITKDEFVNGCLNDDGLVQELTGEPNEHGQKKNRILIPRYSVSVENRCTTERRYLNCI